MEGFEKLLQNSPLRFLEDLVLGMRLHSPFNLVHIGAHLKRHGVVTTVELSEAYSEVYSGRGASCVLQQPFFEDFLKVHSVLTVDTENRRRYR